MYALDLKESPTLRKPELKLVWTHPNPVIIRESEPDPFMICRSRRHAKNIVRLMEAGYIREVRRGDKLTFHVFEGVEPSPLRLVRGLRSAA